MPPRDRRAPRSSRSTRIGALIALVFGVTAGVVEWQQIRSERAHDLAEVDLAARAQVTRLEAPILAFLANGGEGGAEALTARLEGYGHLLGAAVYRPDGTLIAGSPGAIAQRDANPSVLEDAQRADTAVLASVRSQGAPVRLLVVPILQADTLRALAVVATDISFLAARSTERLVRAAIGIPAMMLLLLIVVVAATWLTYDRQLARLASWMRRLRLENVPESPPGGLPILFGESDRLAASLRAARSVSLEESEALVRADRQWTRERLRAHALACLQHGQLVVVSNREPYLHVLENGVPRAVVPAGGLVTALDPVLQACGGLWVAHGSGDADRQCADAEGRLTMPPDDPRYTLRRIWISKEEEQGYYYGFSNQGLWPLCHLAHERPVFRAGDWRRYIEVNRRFADTVLDEIGSGDAMVLVQDYQLALVPQLIKSRRPELRVGLFWHIPWPNPDVFRICPWGTELLQGMLGADLVGFHLQQYCNNFIETVDRQVESRTDRERFAIESQGHTTFVRPFPISVEGWEERQSRTDAELEGDVRAIRARFALDGQTVAVGVDRIDYTKGLLERLRAVRRFLERNPEAVGRFTLLQLAAPSRTHIKRYRRLMAELEALADEVNWAFQTEHWKPIHLLVAHHAPERIHAYLRVADLCIVSSLHDGMNLVAKEYVVARPDNLGVLILSEFAGAAQELHEALLINPYDIEQFSTAIRTAVQMPLPERRSRMQRMRRTVEEHNVYRWAARLLTDLAEIDTLQGEPTAALAESVP